MNMNLVLSFGLLILHISTQKSDLGRFKAEKNVQDLQDDIESAWIKIVRNISNILLNQAIKKTGTCRGKRGFFTMLVDDITIQDTLDLCKNWSW